MANMLIGMVIACDDMPELDETVTSQAVDVLADQWADPVEILG
jgi:hypothetical protein